RLGGAANVARNIVALGAGATLVGLVGDDEPGQEIQDLAIAAGIKASLIRDAGLPTTLKMRVMGRQQQLLRVDFEETPSADSLQRMQAQAVELIARHDMLVLSDYAKGALSQVQGLIQTARNAGVPVLVDPKGH